MVSIKSAPRFIRNFGIVTGMAVLAALGLTACQSAKSDSGSADSGTINFWTWAPDQQKSAVWLDAFKKAYPKITVNYRYVQFGEYPNTIRVGLQGDAGPDVFMVQPGALTSQFAPLTADLTPLADANLPGWKDKLISTDQENVKGKQVALPWNLAAGGLIWYNKTIFDKVGATIPTDLASWKATCATLKAAGYTCFAHGAKDDWGNADVFQMIINEINPGLFYDATAGKKSFNAPDMVKAFDVWKSLFDQEIMPPGALALTQYPDAGDLFMNGKAAMMALGTWNDGMLNKSFLKFYSSTYGDQITKQVFLPIKFPDVVGGAKELGRLFGGPDTALAISSKSKSKDAAFTFIKWMVSSPESQGEFAKQLNGPALKGIPLDMSDLVEPTLGKAALDYQVEQWKNIIGPRNITEPTVATALGQALSGVASGQVSSSDAAANVQKAISDAKTNG